jgi:hypothetical protein
MVAESIAKIPLSGISVLAGTPSLGPVLDAQLGTEMASFEGFVSVLTSVTATSPDTARLQAALLGPSNKMFSLWALNLDTEGLKMQAEASLTFNIFLSPALKLQAGASGRSS